MIDRLRPDRTHSNGHHPTGQSFLARHTAARTQTRDREQRTAALRRLATEIARLPEYVEAGGEVLLVVKGRGGRIHVDALWQGATSQEKSGDSEA